MFELDNIELFIMKVYVGRILELFLKDLGLVERGSIWEVGSVYYLCVE